MDKRAEILSMVERPLHWPVEEKLRIMEAALAPGAVIADRNGVCRSLLYIWLRQACSGQLAGISLLRRGFSLRADTKSKSPRPQSRLAICHTCVAVLEPPPSATSPRRT